MKPSSFGALAVVGGTIAASFVLGPSRPTTPLASAGASLPATGTGAAVIRIRHGAELEAPAAPMDVYEQYAPPPPTPAPAPAPTPWPVRVAQPYVAPANYVTIPVPVYRQAMTLDCETSAMRM